MNTIALQIDFAGKLNKGKTIEQFLAEFPSFTALQKRPLRSQNDFTLVITPVSPLVQHRLLPPTEWDQTAGESTDATTALHTLRTLAQLEVLNAKLKIAGMSHEKSVEWLLG